MSNGRLAAKIGLSRLINYGLAGMAALLNELKTGRGVSRCVRQVYLSSKRSVLKIGDEKAGVKDDAASIPQSYPHRVPVLAEVQEFRFALVFVRE